MTDREHSLAYQTLPRERASGVRGDRARHR